MSQGTLYSDNRTRCLAPISVVKYFGLDVSISEKDAKYTRDFPLNKTPTFIGAKGFKLTEAIAITLYRMLLFSIGDTHLHMMSFHNQNYTVIPVLTNYVDIVILKAVLLTLSCTYKY